MPSLYMQGVSAAQRQFSSSPAEKSSKNDAGTAKDPTTKSSVAIDRTGLFHVGSHSHSPAKGKEPETDMCRHIKALIQFRGGPITIAEYMSEVLTNPSAGYYTTRNVFGRAGDFITSPEISQLFGEMVGIWCVWMWHEMGKPHALRLVELGPGKGTLMADLLRSTAAFKDFSLSITADLVEVSDALRERQQSALDCSTTATVSDAGVESHTSGLTGIPVRWHRSLETVSSDSPAIYIAHEFFDALPVHHFQKTDRGWRERLVDVSEDEEDPLHLRMVLAPNQTPASKLLLQRRLEALPPDTEQWLRYLEVCPQGMAIAGDLAKRVVKEGGAALVIDYGRDRPYPASLAAIRDHGFVNMLSSPGTADLSAHIDFSALRQGVEEAADGAAACHGPISQARFLEGLGVRERLSALLENASEDEAADLISGYERLVTGSEPDQEDAQSSVLTGGVALEGALGGESSGGTQKGGEQQEGMGQTYKAFAILPASKPTPVPFN
ncbi:g3808 [Coccomyxa elongata]